MSVEFVNATSSQIVRIATPGGGAVSAEGSTWLDYRDAVYEIAKALGCKPLRADILAALPKPTEPDYAANATGEG